MEADVADRTRPMCCSECSRGWPWCSHAWRLRVLAYAVAQRTLEIGVRMAMGAKPEDVTRMILGLG